MDFNSNKQATNLKRIYVIVILAVLLVSNIFFGAKYFSAQIDLRQAKLAIKTEEINRGVLRFTRLFIAEVLKAKGEVDFETRLKLETAVRDLNDQEILARWQKFVDSEVEIKAQENVKDLLEVLVNKIQIY